MRNATFSRYGAYFAALICVLELTVQSEAQAPGSIPVQTAIDMAAAAGGALAPTWAQGVGYINEVANGGYQLRQGNYLGFAQQEINARTVDAAEAAGDLAGGPVGGAVAASLTQGALDVGDLVIAPRVADALIHYFPGVFIPAQAAANIQTNPFGTAPPGPISRAGGTTAVSSTVSNDSSQQSPRYSQFIFIPVHASSPASQTNAALQSPSNTWLVAMMNNPNNDLSERKLAAIALGINPDIITSSPAATKLLKAIYNVPDVNSASSTPHGTTPNNDPTLHNSGRSPTADGSAARTGSPTKGAESVTTIVPGRQPAQASVTVIKPSGPPSSSTIKTITPEQSNDRSTPSGNRVIASTTPSSPGKIPPSPSASAPPAVPASPVVRGAPGGISLSQAAAERLPLNINLDSAYIDNDRIILSGRENASASIDAALFLTAVRAACDAGDPYFSLDPDDGQAWLSEGQQAFDRLWRQISSDINWDVAVPATRANIKSHSLWIRTMWVRRDYPDLWNRVAADYPHLQSRLVFRPVWLRQTRFGQIMYEADVLLKELASGVSILSPGQLRAANLPGYVSQLARENAASLFAGLHQEKVITQWRGSRFWFDIAPRMAVVGNVVDRRGSAEDRSLFDSLIEKRMIAIQSNPVATTPVVFKDGDAIDLSRLFPTMFVRRHDVAQNIDLPDDDLTMNSLSNDINDHIQQYVEQYRELRQLTQIIRAYVAAVQALRRDAWICAKLNDLPLLDAEKVSHPLPVQQPSELAVSVARYAVGTGRAVQTLFVQSVLVQGGVTIAGKSFESAVTSTGMPTPITRFLNTEVGQKSEGASLADRSERRILIFLVDDWPNAPPTSSSVALPAPDRPIWSNQTGPFVASPGDSDGGNEPEIENEPPPAKLPSHGSWFGR